MLGQARKDREIVGRILIKEYFKIKVGLSSYSSNCNSRINNRYYSSNNCHNIEEEQDSSS